jgi:hypothetical protein
MLNFRNGERGESGRIVSNFKSGRRAEMNLNNFMESERLRADRAISRAIELEYGARNEYKHFSRAELDSYLNKLNMRAKVRKAESDRDLEVVFRAKLERNEDNINRIMKWYCKDRLSYLKSELADVLWELESKKRAKIAKRIRRTNRERILRELFPEQFESVEICIRYL